MNVTIVSLDDLILMKEFSGRGKDLDDIQKLKLVKQFEIGNEK